MPKGRGFGKLTKGARVETLAGLTLGTVLLKYSEQFDAENTVRVTKHLGDRVYVRFVDAANTQEFLGPEMCIWDFELEREQCWIAIQPERMDSGKRFRAKYLAGKPERTENELWRKVDPKDVHRIKCDRSHMCGENAIWATRTALPCTYVCDYHRAVFDATGTLWNDDTAA